MPYPPTIRKVNPADTPILVLGLTSDTLPLTTVDAYAENILLQKISQISGVGLVGIGGQQKPAVRVQLDPQALAARGINLEDVRTALGQANVDLAKGTLNSPRQTYTLNTNDQLLKADDYANLVIAYRNGAPVRIRDVGRAISAPENDLIAGWYNQKRAVILAIQRQPGANVINTVNRIKAMMPVLQASIPPAVKVNIISDRTETIRASVSDVQFTLMLTVALVVMVIFIFLRNFWATVIPAVTVPLSLIGTFAVLYELGYSLDNLSLMALSIAVGFVVDDAVVVIENIVRHMEEGASPFEAALKGAGEIGFTIVSITLSLIAVFIPLFLMGGYVGLLFREFAITVSVALVLSLLISLTLTPMMCACLLKPESKQHGWLYRLSERGFDGLRNLYEAGLKIVLRHRFITLMTMLGTIALTGYLYVVIPKGFFPEQDTGLIIGLSEAAQDISFQAMAERQQALLNALMRDPAVASVGAAVGAGGGNTTVNNGRVYIALKPKNQRGSMDRGARAAADQPRQDPGHHALYAGRAGHHHRRARVQDDVSVHAERRRSRRAQPLGRVVPRQDQGHPRHHRRRHRSAQCRAAARHHDQARSRVELRHLALYDRQYARRRLRPADRLDHVHDFEPVSCRHGGRPQVPVLARRDQRHLCQIFERAAGAVIDPGRFGSEGRAARGQPSGPVPVGDDLVQPDAGHRDRPGGQRHPEDREKQLGKPLSLQTSFQGNAQAFGASLSSTPILIVAALFVIYIILGVLYESLIHPITIISTLPSAGLGALLLLMAVHYDLSVIAIVGIILLIGIVKKNGIMLVDFAQHVEHEQGLTAEESIYQACIMRFRPILMTTMAALLGGVPMMLGTGVGSEIRQPLGYAIVGGLALSQVLTLYTTPVVYIYLDRLQSWLFGEKKQAASGHAAPAPAE